MWAAAWHSVYRLPVGTTAETLAVEVAAERAVEKVLTDAERTPERYAVDRFLGELFPPTGGDDGAPGGTFGGRSPNGPQNGGDGAYRGFPKETPAVATPLVGKGNKSTERQPEESPERPLDEDDLNKVRALADALGDAAKLSARNVRETVGCRNEYAVRLRDAVKAERGTDSPE